VLKVTSVFDEIGVVFAAEFVRRIRSRAFIIGTLLGVASIFLIAALPSLFERGAAGASKRLLLAGPSALIGPASTLLRRDEELQLAGTFATQDVPKEPTRQFLERHGNAAALLVLARTPHGLATTAYARDPGIFPAARIARDLAPLEIALATGIPVERISAYAPQAIDVRGIGGRYTTAESADVARGIATFLTMILYIVVLMNSQMLTTSVAEEKTSRIAELLVAAISPSSLLAGKVLSSGAIGLLQLAIWSLAGFGIVGPLGGNGNQPSPQTLIELTDALTPEIVAAFLVFFLIGFLQYALLFAAGASLISRTEDLGSITVPLILPVIAALMIAQFAIAAPTAPTVIVTSFLPLVSPFVMFTRMLISDVPAWQVALAFVFNVAALCAIVPFAGKIYRVGLLLYGRTPKLTQIWTVLRT